MSGVGERFWAKVEKTAGCWLWKGTSNETGYGFMNVNNRVTPSHRIVYELLIGPIPPGLTIDHLCRVRRCVNPMHIEAVTIGENVRRGMRLRYGPICPKGHPYTDENTFIRSNRPGRNCKQCNRDNVRRYKANKA